MLQVTIFGLQLKCLPDFPGTLVMRPDIALVVSKPTSESGAHPEAALTWEPDPFDGERQEVI